MISEKHLIVIKKIAKILSNKKIDWTLIGSANLSLQGVEIEANDIDILTDKKGIEEIDSLLSEFRIQKPTYSSTNMFRSCRGLYIIESIQIDIMSDFQYHKKDSLWSEKMGLNEKNFIELNGIKIPIRPLKKEYEFYIRMRRLEKAKKIKEVLDKN